MTDQSTDDGSDDVFLTGDVICLGEIGDLIRNSKHYPSMFVADSFLDKFKEIDDRLRLMEEKKKKIISDLKKLDLLAPRRPYGRVEAATVRPGTQPILAAQGSTDVSQNDEIVLLEDEPVQLEDRTSVPSRATQKHLNETTAERLHKRVEVAAGSSGTQSVLGATGRKVTSQNSTSDEVISLEEDAEPVQLEDEDRNSTRLGTLQERFSNSTSDDMNCSRLSSRPLLQEKVYVEVSASDPWKRGRIERHVNQPDQSVKYEIKVHSAGLVLVSGRRVAYWKPPRNAPMAIGTRVIACPDPAPEGEHNEYFPGLIGESPSPDNRDRYLIIFNRGDACYLRPRAIRLVCDLSRNDRYIESLCDGNHRTDVRQGDKIKMKRGTSWHGGVVLEVDCSIAKVKCRAGNLTKWIFLTDRFIKKRKPADEPIPIASCVKTPSNGCAARVNGTLGVNGTSANGGINNPAAAEERFFTTGESPTATSGSSFTEDIQLPVDTPKPRKRPHAKCGPYCINWVSPRFRDRPVVIDGGQGRHIVCWNPLAIPLLQGWRRKVVMREQAEVRYTTPCGKPLWTMEGIFQYLRAVESPLTMDLFDVDCRVRPLARLKMAREDRVVIQDLSYGKEPVPISVYNDHDDELPVKFRYWRSYSRHPPTDHKFLSTCSCDDGCRSSRACSCTQISCVEMKTLYRSEDLPNYCYNFRRLLGRIDSGVFECNSWCQCPVSCLNRVAQNPLSLELQVFKTPDKGWGVRCMYDIPQGTFISTYSGDMLSDTDAEAEGSRNGDEYFVEMDYQQVFEQAKEGYESGPQDEFDDLSPPVSKKRKHDSLSPSLENTAGTSSNDPPRLREHQPEEAASNFVVNAKHRGNISRFLNHSCDPNVFAQNVFIDSHDLQLPKVALFASRCIPAGEELTWDYGYTPNSLPGKELKCKCGSSECDGRLL